MSAAMMGTAYLVQGGPETTAAAVLFLEEGGITVRENPDVLVRSYRQFGIEEARELRERAASRAFAGNRVFVVAAPHITREAQNALLKTLEEPPADATFIFITPSPETLLPTLRSRMQALELGKAGERGGVNAAEFLAAMPQKRLDLLKPLLEKGEDEKRDLGAILAFLGSLEKVLSEKADRRGLAALYRARAYIADRGALVKPLLEQLALLAPRV